MVEDTMTKEFRVVVLIMMLVQAANLLAADPFLSGLKNPTCVTTSQEGHIYVGESGGRILVVNKAVHAETFATGMDNPKGIASFQKWLYVTDNQRVWRIDEKGNASVFAVKEAFPAESPSLNGVAIDENGVLYVSDSGDANGKGGAVYRIDHAGKVKRVADSRTIPGLGVPTGLVLDGVSHLLLLDSATGKLLRVRIADGTAATVAEGFEGGEGLAWDWFGQLFITSHTQGKVWGIARPGQKAVPIASGVQSPGKLCLDPTGKSMLITDAKSGTLTALSTSVPGSEVDSTPLPFKEVPAFPKLKWTGWQGFTEQGKVAEHRPVFLTHAGAGSQRNFVILQQGTIHVFPNDPDAQNTKVFLDIHEKVRYTDNENEQGLLGLAFHPSYKTNGQFFVFYTVRTPRLTNVLSRFRVSKDDPDRADAASEEELLRIPRPFWNHDGGTICFGPDNMLYVVLGDGGAANDPFKNGQNLKKLLGKILRIDVDNASPGKKYGIPADNPFAGVDGAAPEIWAYGVRNPWRIAFDRKTGWLWAGDVGQNLYEEIDIIIKGGNYGWNTREGLHPFGTNGVGPRVDLIDPIWEYHHDVGNSITGGLVYRGKRLHELEGYYIYGDYVSGRIWALKYDDSKKRVVANRPLLRTKVPIFSFGEDEQNEIYFLGPTLTGQGIFRLDAAPANAD
jgi:glucose/arabinose dehydrogenase